MGKFMKTHHIDMLEAAKKLLAEMDSNELINEFLELQTDACGTSVDDFFKIMMRTTDDLYGFKNLGYSKSSDEEI